MLGSTNGLFPEITSKSFFGGGIVTLLVNGMFWPTPPGGKGLHGFVPFSIKSSILGNEGGGPNRKLFKSAPPPPGLILLLLLLLIKLSRPIPLS